MERKVKYDYVFKLECVKLVLEKHYSCNSVCTQKDLERSNLWKIDWFLQAIWQYWFTAKKEPNLFG